MTPTTSPPRPALFGSPALPRPRREPPPTPPTVSATATGTHRMGRVRVVEVDVMVSGLVFTALVRGERVVGPMHRGQSAVRFTDRALAEEALRVAVEAARDAERRGWLA